MRREEERYCRMSLNIKVRTLTLNTIIKNLKSTVCKGTHSTASPHTHKDLPATKYCSSSMPGMFSNKTIFCLSCFPDFSIQTRLIVSCLYSNRPLIGKCLSVCCGLNYIDPMIPVKSKFSSQSKFNLGFPRSFP